MSKGRDAACQEPSTATTRYPLPPGRLIYMRGTRLPAAMTWQSLVSQRSNLLAYCDCAMPWPHDYVRRS